MISHKHKFIFIHIPKCAGSSIRDFYFDTPKLDWRQPNYELLYGWCPERRIHLQHATPKELIETNLIQKDVWDEYFKFAFVRNPWGRAYSDYKWIMLDSKVKDSFKNFIQKKGAFEKLLNDKSVKEYRGDHLRPQIEYFGDKDYPLDFIGRFENLQEDINKINDILNIAHSFNVHSKNNTKNKLSHYSKFYTDSNKKIIDNVYLEDIVALNYRFEDFRSGFDKFKKLF
ncbi:sulfotransferase family 2 domain-containing protein [Xanthomarina sp.]|uniref:sulfotransferase family 2 domain-containing protein n=1 Tax=Xanthomarina sp. TaxID=1931211 RepID=UPI002BD96D0F|nr:sulfotransferase family 2 domain-containing protein [Xanthomarina sp.]HLV40541.1 sulfotransferase family 2 domain-containing protein [Xanthomarina sp.]